MTKVYVKFKVLFVKPDNRLEKTLILKSYMPFPPTVGLDILVGEEIEKISQVIYDHKTQRYEAYCEFYFEGNYTEEEMQKHFRRFLYNGWWEEEK